MPLFSDAIDLKLLNTRTFKSGLLALTYAPAT
jgi:hypothetical protein